MSVASIVGLVFAFVFLVPVFFSLLGDLLQFKLGITSKHGVTSAFIFMYTICFIIFAVYGFDYWTNKEESLASGIGLWLTVSLILPLGSIKLFGELWMGLIEKLFKRFDQKK
jgi:hypothetical protein